MLVKNKSARGWHVNGVLIAPGATEPVECSEADVKDNADLEIVSKKTDASKPDADAVEARAKADSKLNDAEWTALSAKDKKVFTKAATDALVAESAV